MTTLPCAFEIARLLDFLSCLVSQLRSIACVLEAYFLSFGNLMETGTQQKIAIKDEEGLKEFNSLATSIQSRFVKKATDAHSSPSDESERHTQGQEKGETHLINHNPTISAPESSYN